jgi:septum formation protein
MANGPSLILASGSHARRRMLAAAGVSFKIDIPRVSESKVKDNLLLYSAASGPKEIALALAEAKAHDVSNRNSGALVIGSDQVLAQGERLFNKAADGGQARQTLQALRGTTHCLHSAAALVQNGDVLWRHVEAAQLTMRDFSDAWLDGYVATAGDALTNAVGCYHLEGAGVQLFEKIEGDYFTILGMPLLPLLSELRRREVIAA